MTTEKRMIKYDTTPGQITIPENIYGEILKIGDRQASVAAMTNIFLSDGKIKFLADLGNTPAKIYTEGNQPTAETLTPNLLDIHIRKNRMASVIQTSKTMVNLGMQPQFDNLVEYKFANSFLLGMEDQMFNSGDAEGKTGLQNIILHNNAVDEVLGNGKIVSRNKIENIATVTGTSAGALTYKDIVEAYEKFTNQDGNLNGAVWVVESISKLANIKDDSGLSVYKFGNKGKGEPDTVFGIPVGKVAKFTEGQKVGTVLMNPKNAYAVPVSEQQMSFRKVEGDTIQAKKGGVLFVGDVYLGGKVVNPRAIVIVKTA